MRRLVIAALLAVALPTAVSAQNVGFGFGFEVDPDAQRITSQGVGEVLAPAARATALFVVESEGALVADVARENAAVRASVVAALGRLGLSDDAWTLVSLGAGDAAGTPRVRAPGQPVPPTLKETKAGIQVVVEPAERVDEVVNAVLEAGASQLVSVSFEAADTPEVRREAVRLAVAQATVDAQAMADAAGMRVGRLLQMYTLPDFTRTALASTTLFRASVVGQGVMVSPSPVTVRIMVQAVWELLPG